MDIEHPLPSCNERSPAEHAGDPQRLPLLGRRVRIGPALALACDDLWTSNVVPDRGSASDTAYRLSRESGNIPEIGTHLW
jgi:hypothetical protein